MQIEVVFAQFEVVQNWHASRGRTDCTIRGRLGIVPKRAFGVQFQKYIEFILKSLDFLQGFQIQLQFLHSGIQTEKCSQNLPDKQKGIHVYT
jgi:hypothetical protein